MPTFSRFYLSYLMSQADASSRLRYLRLGHQRRFCRRSRRRRHVCSSSDLNGSQGLHGARTGRVGADACVLVSISLSALSWYVIRSHSVGRHCRRCSRSSGGDGRYLRRRCGITRCPLRPFGYLSSHHCLRNYAASGPLTPFDNNYRLRPCRGALT